MLAALFTPHAVELHVGTAQVNHIVGAKESVSQQYIAVGGMPCHIPVGKETHHKAVGRNGITGIEKHCHEIYLIYFPG